MRWRLLRLVHEVVIGIRPVLVVRSRVFLEGQRVRGLCGRRHEHAQRVLGRHERLGRTMSCLLLLLLLRLLELVLRVVEAVGLVLSWRGILRLGLWRRRVRIVELQLPGAVLEAEATAAAAHIVLRLLWPGPKPERHKVSVRRVAVTGCRGRAGKPSHISIQTPSECPLSPFVPHSTIPQSHGSGDDDDAGFLIRSRYAPFPVGCWS